MKRFFRSFLYAFRGLNILARSGGNIPFHIGATVIVIAAGIYFNLSSREWCFILFAIGFVFTAEGFNTAIERLVDFVSPAQNEKAGAIKDLAAAAVLISAITAALVGVLIFLPKIMHHTMTHCPPGV